MKLTFVSALLFLCIFGQPLLARELGEPDLDGDEFIERFTASYGVLSEKEPPLSDLEIAILKKMAPMMRVDKANAQQLLQSLTVAEEGASASFNYLLGNIYFENEEYFLAEEQYKTAIERFPDFLRAWKNLGVLKLRSGDTRSALISLLKAVELGDNDSYTFGMLGYCHFKEGNYVSAEVAYDRAVLAEPENLDWLEGKAQVYLEVKRYNEAIRLQDELIARRPNDIQYWRAQTNAYLAAEDLKSTARNLEIIRALGHEDFQTLFLLGSLYAKLDMRDASAGAYMAASQYADDSDFKFLAKAGKQLLHNDQSEAAKALLAKLDNNKEQMDEETQFDYHLIRAEVASDAGNAAEAIGALEQAEALQPTNGDVLIRLARLHGTNGNRTKAYYLLERAEQDPDSEYNALLTRAKLLIDEKRFQESQVYVSRALKIEATDTVQNLYNQLRQAAHDSSDS